MTRINRRKVLGGLAVVGTAVAATSAISQQSIINVGDIKKESDIACLYHCDFGEPSRIGQMVRNINNHLSVYDFDPFKVKIVVVTHAQGIKPFLKDFEGTPWAADKLPPDLFSRFEGLAKYGVEVYLCALTFKGNNIDMAKARTESFIKVVPSGVATVAELQGKGFAYLKVG